MPNIVHTPAECEPNCHDDLCPYIHSDMWQYRRKDGTLSNGFYSEEAALSAAVVDPMAEE